MEIWDAYNKDGSKAGFDLIREGNIPNGYYHLVCEVIVKHIDGDFLFMQRDYTKSVHPGKYELSAGGSAVKGENALQCIKRELYEETGLIANQIKEVSTEIYDDNHAIFTSFFAVIDCSKDSIILQKTETINYKWLDREELFCFIESPDFISGEYKMRIKNILNKILI